MMSNLNDINGALEQAGAAYRLLKLGGKRGEGQITKFNKRSKVTDFLSVLSFFWIPPWSLEKSAENVSEHVMLESKDTAVVLAIVNDKYVITTQQHRPIFSRWYNECTRGWNQKEGGAEEILRRKLPNLLGDPSRGIIGIAKLDGEKGIATLIPAVAEDTGLRTNNITYYVAHTTCIIPELEGQSEKQVLKKLLTEVGNDIFRISVYTIGELDDHLIELMTKQNPGTNKGFIEAISISAWTIYYFYRMHQDRINTTTPE